MFSSIENGQNRRLQLHDFPDFSPENSTLALKLCMDARRAGKWPYAQDILSDARSFEEMIRRFRALLSPKNEI